MIQRLEGSGDKEEADSSLFSELPCGICRLALDQDFTILEANHFYYGIYGYTKQEAQRAGFTCSRFVLPPHEFNRLYNKAGVKLAEGQSCCEIEYQGIHKKTGFIWLMARCVWNGERPGEIRCVVLEIGWRRQLQEELRISLEETRLAFKLSGKLICTYDIETGVLNQSKECAEMFGLPQKLSEMPESLIRKGGIAPECAQTYRRFYRNMRQGIPSGHMVVKRRKRSGGFCWYEADYALVFGRNGKPKKGIIACRDISEQYEKEQAYRKWSQYLSSQKEQCVGSYEYNLTQNCLENCTGVKDPAVEQKSYTEAGVHVAERMIVEEDRDKFYHFYDRERMLLRFYEKKRSLFLEYRVKNTAGSCRWIRADVLMTADPYTGDVKMFLTLRDINAEKKKELALLHKVETDQMTGVLNRCTFIERVSEQLERRDDSVRHALILLDIDHFKELNDNYGHQFGDLVLIDTAALLKKNIRKNDLCGRLGGDEFILFLNSVTGEKEAERRIMRLCHALNRQYRGAIKVSSSLGAAFYPRDGMEFQKLYRNADLALYEAKKAGRSRYAVYAENTGNIDS